MLPEVILMTFYVTGLKKLAALLLGEMLLRPHVALLLNGKILLC